MLESFQIMDYSFLMAIEKVDAEKLRTSTLRPTQDNVPSFYQYSEILGLPMLRHQKGIPARTENGEELRLYVGIIDILQKYVLKKKLEHRVKAVFLESQDSEVSVTHPTKFQRRFMNFMKTVVFKEGTYPPGYQPSPQSQPAAAGRSTFTHGHTLAAPTASNGGMNQRSKTTTFNSSSSGFHSDVSPTGSTTQDPRASATATRHFSSSGSQHIDITPRNKRPPLDTSISSSAYTSADSSANATLNAMNDTTISSNSTNYNYQRPNTLPPHQPAQYPPHNDVSVTPRANGPYNNDQVDFEVSAMNTSTPRPKANSVVSTRREIRTASTASPALAKQESLTQFNSDLEDGYSENMQSSRGGSRGSYKTNHPQVMTSYESSEHQSMTTKGQLRATPEVDEQKSLTRIEESNSEAIIVNNGVHSEESNHHAVIELHAPVQLVQEDCL